MRWPAPPDRLRPAPARPSPVRGPRPSSLAPCDPLLLRMAYPEQRELHAPRAVLRDPAAPEERLAQREDEGFVVALAGLVAHRQPELAVRDTGDDAGQGDAGIGERLGCAV